MNKRLAALRRRHFGQRSERLADQLELQIEQMEQILERTAAPTAQPVRPVRKPLPASLPRAEEVLAPPYALCPGCGVELRRIGEDVSEVLEIVPARLRVRRYVRPVMACRCCGDISQAAPPPLPIPKSNAAPSLLADIALAKYDDHLPAYRQAERFARAGVELPRSTLSPWLGRRPPRGRRPRTSWTGSASSDLPPLWRTPLLAHAAKTVTSNWAGLR